MSGFEVAGVILGVIPLLVSALEHYANSVRTIQRFRRYKYELKTLALELKTEQTLFRNTCELLLDGIVDDQAIDEQLTDPDGELWSKLDFQKNLQKRLGSSYEVYIERVRAMKSTLEHFRNRLELNDKWVVRWSTDAFLQRACKVGKLSLSKSAYNDVIQQLKGHNRALQELTKQTMLLRPSRTQRSWPKRLQLLGKRTEAFFATLEYMDLCCRGTHSTALELLPQPLQSSPSNGSSPLHHTSTGISVALSWIRKEPGACRQSMQETVEISVQSEQYDSECSTTKPHGADLENPSKKRKSVRWKDDSGSKLHPIPTPTEGRIGQDSRIMLKSKCQILRQDPSLHGYIGSLADSLVRFDLFRPSKIRIESHLDVICLKDLFDENSINRPKVTRADKLAFSAAVATGVLWAPQLTTFPDIQDLLVRDPKKSCHMPVKRVFLKTNRTPKSQKRPVYIENLTMFMLGLTLIQICFGQSMGALRSTEGDDSMADLKEQYAAEYFVAKKLLSTGKILEESGWEYENAVRFCIMGDHTSRTNDLDDESFRLSVWENVVSPLATIFEEFQRPTAQRNDSRPNR
jgi:hypothetical protein